VIEVLIKKGAGMNKFFLTTMLTVSSVFAFSDANDTSSIAQSITQLQRRMDLLETEFHTLKIEKSDNTPGATGQIRNWGKGLYIGGHLDFLITDLEIGYMFNLKHCRIGGAAGLTLNDIIGTKETYEVNRPASLFCKFNIGTPVFLNFVSLLGYAQGLVVIKNDGGQIQQFFGNGIFLKGQGSGFGIGGDLEFWFKKKWNLTLGPEIELLATGNNETSTAFVSGIRFGLKRYF
jgi:hypothetical protein